MNEWTSEWINEMKCHKSDEGTTKLMSSLLPTNTSCDTTFCPEWEVFTLG